MDESSRRGGGPILEGDQPVRPEPFSNLVESKLRPPSMRPGIVARHVLLDRLLASGMARVIWVVAPPGYGKTTVLAQWSERKGPRVAWISIDRRDNDPVLLLRYITVALDRIEPIDPDLFRVLASPGVSVVATVVPRFLAAASAMTQPVTVVLDHLELVENQECLDVVAELALGLPAGSQLALAARRTPSLPVALLRAEGQVVEIGMPELAMNKEEGRALLEATGAGLSEAEMAELVGQTEGWPVGLYLAALASKAAGPRRSSGFAFTGGDRFLADYLYSELLAHLPAEQVAFLTRTAVLEALCGPLCDAVLDVKGSDRVLWSLEDSNLLLVPLDHRRVWYRYHQLFRDLLLAELGRREPELVAELHTRAAIWWEASGRPEVAIDHAQAAGDDDRVARLVAPLIQPAYAGGRVDTAQRWLAWFEERGLAERYPPVAVLGALIQALVGRPLAAERWAHAAEHSMTAPEAGPDARTPPDGSTMEGYLAMLRALLCRDGVDRMRADADAALDGLSPASPWRTATIAIKGNAELLRGQADRADAILAQAVEIAGHTKALPAASAALADRCLLAIQRDDWAQAETLAEQALATIVAGQLDDYVTSPLVHAVAARTALHRGDVPGAKEHLARAARLRPLLTSAIPQHAVQTLLELGRAYLALDDVAGAKAVLQQARDVLQLCPDLGVLPAQVQELWARLEAASEANWGASSLTTAQLRVLPLLSTHLSYPEIGERLYISRNTVKAHAMAIYRKLGVSSRSQAVERAQQLGLLGG